MFQSLKSFSANTVGAAFLVLVLGACIQNADQNAICEQSARWNESTIQIAIVLSNVESTQSGRIQEVFVEVVATLIALNDAAPREIKSDIESLLNTYGALSDAFEAIDWQGGLSQKDAGVTSAAVRLASDDLQQAQANLANYIEDNCNLQLENAVNKFPNVGTTLPDPIIQDEAILEPSVGYDNDESVARAFGFVVVERFGVAITDQQADCVGRALFAATSRDTKIIDQSYWVMLQTIFDSCEVKIDIAKALENE